MAISKIFRNHFLTLNSIYKQHGEGKLLGLWWALFYQNKLSEIRADIVRRFSRTWPSTHLRIKNRIFVAPQGGLPPDSFGWAFRFPPRNNQEYSPFLSYPSILSHNFILTAWKYDSHFWVWKSLRLITILGIRMSSGQVSGVTTCRWALEK